MSNKEMEIVGERLIFGDAPQVDPEGQKVVKEFRARAPAAMQGAPSPSAAVQGGVGDLPAVIQYTGTAGEMANAVRTACAGCKHWDNRALLQFISNAEGPASTAESRETALNMRKRAQMAGLDLTDFGVCRVLSDWVESIGGRDPFFWPSVSWRGATCPNICQVREHTLNVVTPADPFGFFTPVDTDAEKIGANRYDVLLKAVQEQNRR